MKGYQIKIMLQEMSVELNSQPNNLESEFHISKSGVPYVHVIVKGKRYQFTYFGKSTFFRIFDYYQNPTNLKTRKEVITHFVTLNQEKIVE